MPGLSVAKVFAQKLGKPTSLGETTAVHVKLPPPANRGLASSLVRVVGDSSGPTVLFRSDTLARLGVIPASPGPEFFTLFARLPEPEVERREESERRLASGEFGMPTRETVLFNGRHPAARYEGLPMDANAFAQGALVPQTSCPWVPASTEDWWERTQMIRDPAVVLDPARTWDPCTGAGTKGGVWTFAHLMREMAQGSGASPEDFVLNWLSLWLNDFQSNGDTVPARRKMYDEVIAPWATASGTSSSLDFNVTTGRWEVALRKPLDLDLAPFRLLAIVNRIDLAGSTDYLSGRRTGGAALHLRADAPLPLGRRNGGDVQPQALHHHLRIRRAGRGVPGHHPLGAAVGGVGDVPHLQGGLPVATPADDRERRPAWAGAGKGNRSALNQLRTNEVALGLPWNCGSSGWRTSTPAPARTPPPTGCCASTRWR